MPIYNKPLIQAPVRLQKMLLMLQPYTFNLVYKKGKDLVLADALFKAFPNDIDNDFEKKCTEMNMNLCAISLENFNVSR